MFVTVKETSDQILGRKTAGECYSNQRSFLSAHNIQQYLKIRSNCVQFKWFCVNWLNWYDEYWIVCKTMSPDDDSVSISVWHGDKTRAEIFLILCKLSMMLWSDSAKRLAWMKEVLWRWVFYFFSVSLSQNFTSFQQFFYKHCLSSKKGIILWVCFHLNMLLKP